MRNRASIALISTGLFFGISTAGFSNPHPEYRQTGANGTSSRTYKLIRQIETLWPKHIESYSIRCDALIGRLRVSSKRDPTNMEMLEQLVLSLVKKEDLIKTTELPNDESRALLAAQVRGIQTLLSNANVLNSRGEDRLRYAQIAASFINRISKQVIPDFKRIPVYMNVMPPIGPGPRIAGMSPSGIEDPIAREAYLQALRDNERNGAINGRQWQLRTSLKLLEFQLNSFINNSLKKYPEMREQGLEVLESINHSLQGHELEIKKGI